MNDMFNFLLTRVIKYGYIKKSDPILFTLKIIVVVIVVQQIAIIIKGRTIKLWGLFIDFFFVLLTS